jgi:transcriptional regulator GlxA family with amidase domain
LTALTGRPLGRHLDFKPAMRLKEPHLGGLTAILDCALKIIAGSVENTNAFVLAELEQALIVALLTASDHNCRHLFDAPVSRGVPWQVRRVEEYIEANWERPVAIEEMAALTGSSARTIFRAFQRTRGYSPMEFSKQIRLCKARDMLRSDDRSRTVMEAAFACGFSDLSHFSRDFSRAFGDTPSSVLKFRT